MREQACKPGLRPYKVEYNQNGIVTGSFIIVTGFTHTANNNKQSPDLPSLFHQNQSLYLQKIFW
jgi:hypothetical protein